MNTRFRVAAATVAVLVPALLAGCSSEPPAAAPSPTSAKPKVTAPSAPLVNLQLGQGISLPFTDQASDAKATLTIAVTKVALATPAEAGQFGKADPATRLWHVRARITNTAGSPVASPAFAETLYDGSGGNSEPVALTAAYPPCPADTKPLAPGESREFCTVFALPADAEAASVAWNGSEGAPTFWDLPV